MKKSKVSRRDFLAKSTIAEALGARGEYVATPEQYKAALQRAYAQPRNVEPGVTAYAH